MNLGFEDGLTGWTPVAASVLAAAWDVYAEPDTTEGSYCLRFVGDTRPSLTTVPLWLRVECETVFPLEGATSVTAAAWSRQTMSQGHQYEGFNGAEARIGLIWLDAASGRIGTTYGVSGRGATSGLWTDFNWMRMEAEAPPGATACRVFLEARGPDTVELLYDSVGLQIGPTLYGTDTNATFYRSVNRFRGWRDVTRSQVPGASGAAPVAPSTGVPVVPSATTQQLTVASLPRVGEVLVDSGGRTSRSFYTWMQAVDKGLRGVAAVADEAKAGVDALPPALGSADGTVAGIPVGGTRTTVLGRFSVQSTAAGTGYTLALLGDVAAPGPRRCYGTDSDGEKGWHALADAFAAGAGVTLATDADTGVTTITADNAVPLLVPDGETYTVAANKQALFALPIELEGDAVLVIDGALVEVN